MKYVAIVLCALTFAGCAVVGPQATRESYDQKRLEFSTAFDLAWERAVAYARNCYATTTVSADRFGTRGTIGVRINDVVSAQLFVLDMHANGGGTQAILYGMHADYVKNGLPGWIHNGDGDCS